MRPRTRWACAGACAPRGTDGLRLQLTSQCAGGCSLKLHPQRSICSSLWTAKLLQHQHARRAPHACARTMLRTKVRMMRARADA